MDYSGPGGVQASNQKRNYEKPWQVPESKDPKKKSQGGQNESSFLYSVYPEGVGPDSELIAMLEKDVIDKNPNVSFDEIAELHESKKILQEAVLLPILMP